MRTASSSPSTPPTRSTSPATTTRACRAPAACWTRSPLRCAAVGIDVYQIDHEDANGQFEVNFTYADALTSADNFTLVKMAVSEIARKHGMIGTLHAQAVLQSHGQRRAFPHLDGQCHDEEPVPRSEGSAGPAAVGDGLFLPGRHAQACARAGGDLRAHGELLQAPGGGSRALGRHLGAGLHRLWRQQPHELRAHSRRAPRDAPAGLGLQSLPGHCRHRRRRHGWHRRKLHPGKPTNTNLYEATPDAAEGTGHRRAAAEPARGHRPRSSRTK